MTLQQFEHGKREVTALNIEYFEHGKREVDALQIFDFAHGKRSVTAPAFENFEHGRRSVPAPIFEQLENCIHVWARAIELYSIQREVDSSTLDKKRFQIVREVESPREAIIIKRISA